jgi:branched-chain amino acid transport system substrate-binding protein
MKKLLTSAILGAGLAAGMSGTALAQQGVSDTEIVIGSNGDLSGLSPRSTCRRSRLRR